MTTRPASAAAPAPSSVFWADDAPVLQAHHLENDHPVPVFGQTDRWDLRCLGWNPAAGRSTAAVLFDDADPAWNLRTRELAVALLNPAHDVLRTHGIHRSRVPAHTKTVRMKISALRTFTAWHAANLPDVALPDIRQHHLDAFLDHARTIRAPSTIRMLIAAVRDLHTYRHIITGGGLATRPWGRATALALSGAAAPSGTLSTPVIPPNVWWPLFAACWQYIDVFSRDIFAAEREWQRLDGLHRRTARPRTRTYDDIVDSWLRSSDAYVPTHRVSYGPFHKGEIHWTLLALLATDGRSTGAFTPQTHSPRSAGRRRRVEAALAAGTLRTRPGGLPVRAATVTRRDGSEGPWIDGFDPATIRRQRKILRNACYVFCAALTMMRDSELLSIRKGSLTTFYGAPAVTSRLRKHRHGTQLRNWWIIEPVAQAIAVAERLALGDAVFGTSRTGHAAGLTGFDAHDELRKFIGEVNALGPDAGLEPIPAFHLAPHMFRRTMAVITAQQPDGEIALGIQLKHAARRAVANATTSGYAQETPEWAAEFEHELQESVAAKLVGVWSDAQDGDIPLAGAGAQRFRDGLAATAAERAAAGPVKIGDDRLLRTMLRDRFSALRWGTVNHCLGIPEQAACLQGLPADAAAHGMMPNRCHPATCRNSVITREHLPVWKAEEQDLTEKLRDRKMAPHNRRQLQDELDEVRKITRRFDDA